MEPHDFLSMYSAKAVEYLIAVAYLLLFIPFWRFVNGGRPAEQPAWARMPALAGFLADSFMMPRAVLFHPGHVWARVEGDDLVTVGVDDFAQKLVGPLSGIRLPEVGSRVGQGETAWTVFADAKGVDMLSPVDGTVVAVNGTIANSPETVNQDPYGKGWLLRVKSSRLAANLKHLLSGEFADQWMEHTCQLLSGSNPELGPVSQDGGTPVQGIARAIDPQRWDDLARRFFLV
jgi:glycine cleavage system H protein